MEQQDTIILGAGLSGLSAAFHLKDDYLLLEREQRVGGLARTEIIDGFRFNHTGHWLHLRDERVRRLIDDLMQGQMLTVERKARIYTHGVFTEYPFQANLFGLPKDILAECLKGAVSAAVRRATDKDHEPSNFLEYVRHHFGNGIADHFLVPYNTKLWGVSPDEVTAEWTQRFVPIPDVAQIIDGALGRFSASMGYNATFLYPAEGGIESLPKAFESRLDQKRIFLNTRPGAINTHEKQAEVEGERINYKHLISTIPLPELVDITEDAPAAVTNASRQLRCSRLRYVNVGLKVERPLDGCHWIYLPEARFPFYRIGSASNAAPSLSPEGLSSLYVELSNDRSAPEKDVVDALAGFLKKIGTIEHESDILFAAFRECPYGYVIYDGPCSTSRKTILDFYRDNDVLSIGRYGAWTYNSMEDAILDGIDAARASREE